MVLAFAPQLFHESAFADDWDFDDSDSDMRHISEKDMKTIDIDTSYASYNSLPMYFICGAFERDDDYYYDEKIKVVAYVKKPGGKYKKVKSFTMSEDFYEDCETDEIRNYFGSDIDEDEYPESYEGPELEYDFKIKNLKPYTKYSVRIVCTTTKSNLKRTVTRTFRTAHKPIVKNQVRKSGNIYKWSKVKGAKGYVVNYKKSIYCGKNMFGTKVYKWKYAAKFTTKASVKLNRNCEVVKALPYTMIGKYYSLHGMDYLKSKSKIAKMFKATSEPYYR